MSSTEQAWGLADLWDALFGRIETFVKVGHGGAWFIAEMNDSREFLTTCDDGDIYTFTEVRMTRRQFEKLPEFAGF